MSVHYPSAAVLYPIEGQSRLGFLKNHITRPNIEVGDYTYYDDPAGMQEFERNVLYHFDFVGDRLILGKFCSVAAGAKFIMNGGNHRMDWITTYPFPIFGGSWAGAMPESWPNKGDTVVGSDVWIGHAATFMPGVHVGHGGIVASGSVVTGDVAPYAIVGGNPASEIRSRFEPGIVARLLALCWWDWPIERITRHVKVIGGADIDALERAD